MSLRWPLPGGRPAMPVYRGTPEHIRDGEGAGVDLGNQEGLPWLAIADGSWHTYPQQGGDGRAGWFADLLFRLDGSNYVVRYVHGQHRPIADEDWYSDHEDGRYVTDYEVVAGQRLGTVGHTGYTVPAGAAGAHLHLTVWRDGQRIAPEELLALIPDEEAPVEPTPPHEFTPQEMAALVDAWDTAEWLEAAPDGAMQTYAKAIKNVVRMAKGEPLEQPQAAEEALNE